MNSNIEILNDKKKLNKLKLTVIIIIKLIVSLIASYLVWDCNKNKNLFIKIIFLLIAFIFSEVYILYYAIYRIFMGNKCPV
tara:strand:+ start:26 stop:268 length:243 start_codon:yes stop_codon:yes gene_type:complete